MAEPLDDAVREALRRTADQIAEDARRQMPRTFRYVPDLQPAPSYAENGYTVHVITTLGGNER